MASYSRGATKGCQTEHTNWGIYVAGLGFHDFVYFVIYALIYSMQPIHSNVLSGYSWLPFYICIYMHVYYVVMYMVHVHSF